MAKDVAPPEAEAPKKKGKLLILILAAVVVLALAAAGGAYFLMSKPSADKKAKHGVKVAEGDEEESAGPEDEHPVYEKLEQFTVNLADEQFLQTDIQLRLADASVQEKIKVHMPEVRDSLIRLLSSKTAEELAQSEGKEKLGLEVQKAVNEVLGVKKPSKGVKKVLFSSFIIQ